MNGADQVTTAELVAALRIGERAARKRATKLKIQPVGRACPGGNVYPLRLFSEPEQIAVLLYRHSHSAVPPSADSAATSFPVVGGFAGGERPPAPAGFSLQDGGPHSRSLSQGAREETLAALFEAKPDKAKARAREKLAIVQAYQQLIDRGISHRAAQAAVAAEHGVAPSTAWNLWSAVRREPAQLWLYLLRDNHAGRTARSEMSPEAWETLKADYLRPERPSAAACIWRLKRKASATDWILPSNKTMERRIKDIPRTLRVLARHGTKAVEQIYPAQVRDKRALAALEIINADGYQHNLWVSFPDGEIVRAKTWFWQDVHSSKILAWRTDKTEHTDVIRLSFGDLVEQYGIPAKVVLDNTLAAANKTMSGGIKHRFRFKVRADEPLGIFALFGTQVGWAKVKWGQSKPVERSFGIGGIGEIVDKAPEFSGAWTGANTLDKPDYDGKTRAVPLAQVEEVIAREVAAYNAKTGRRGAALGGRSFDEVFAQSYQATPIRRATEAQQRLWLLATEPVRANSRDGAIVLDAGRTPGYANRYWSHQLVEYAGRQVVARFDPRRLHTGVHVYTLDGRYISFAACIEAKGFDDQDAGREHNRARNQFRKAVRAQLDAERRMDALDVAKTYASLGAGTIPAPARGKVVRGEFRDPLDRPAPADRPDTPEEAAQRAALAAEMAGGKVVALHEEDDLAPYRRCKAIEARLAAGAAVSDDERAWAESYQKSSHYRSSASLAEDFPQLLESAAS